MNTRKPTQTLGSPTPTGATRPRKVNNASKGKKIKHHHEGGKQDS